MRKKGEHIKVVSLFYVVTSLTARIFTLAVITSHSEIFNNFPDCCSVSEFFRYTYHFHSVEVCVNKHDVYMKYAERANGMVCRLPSSLYSVNKCV